jgi:hypothetical protein
MLPTGGQREYFFEKYAWVLVVANAALWTFFAFNALFAPHPVETGSGYPAAAITDLTGYSRLTSLIFIPGVALQLYVGLTTFRKHERSAWLTLLAIPLVGVLNSIIDVTWGPGGVDPISSILIFIVNSGLISIALLISIRVSFFGPKSRGQRIELGKDSLAQGVQH